MPPLLGFKKIMEETFKKTIAAATLAIGARTVRATVLCQSLPCEPIAVEIRTEEGLSFAMECGMYGGRAAVLRWTLVGHGGNPLAGRDSGKPESIEEALAEAAESMNASGTAYDEDLDDVVGRGRQEPPIRKGSPKRVAARKKGRPAPAAHPAPCVPKAMPAGSEMSDEEKDFLAAMSKKASVKEIAEMLGRPYHTVYSRMLKDGCVARRSDRLIARGIPYEVVLSRFVEGWYLEDIIEDTGVSKADIIRAVRVFFGEMRIGRKSDAQKEEPDRYLDGGDEFFENEACAMMATRKARTRQTGKKAILK